MAKVLIILSSGFEEIEAVSIIDILRRADIKVTISTINETLTKGANGITLKADCILKDINIDEFNMVVLPGGAENATNLANDSLTKETLKKFKSDGKFVAAICAAPYALHCANVLNENYTCYPSYEKKIDSSNYLADEIVVVDEKVITSKGPATAMSFALELVKVLKGEEVYTKIKNGLLANLL
ncbi:MAG: DJ-1 family glyoxalase III [Halarcobacter sp.]